jgi:4-hydroxy-4-methyl-2-oxoglutarate aldolase
MADDQLRQLADLTTPGVSDALDQCGIPGQCEGIMPLSRSFRLRGRAWTLRYGPVGDDPGTVGDYIDDIHPEQVVVLDNQGRLDATVWGDLLTTAAASRSVAGTVIDGVCRDIDRSVELNYPIFSRGNWMRTGKDRVRVEEIGGPASLGGIRVEPGDLLLGDGDGLVVIPASSADGVIAAAIEIERAEQSIRDALTDGRSLRSAREAVGYHSLQRRRAKSDNSATRDTDQA